MVVASMRSGVSAERRTLPFEAYLSGIMAAFCQNAATIEPTMANVHANSNDLDNDGVECGHVPEAS